MTNKRRMGAGLQKLLLAGELGLGLIGFGDVVSYIPSEKYMIGAVEVATKGTGYLALSASIFIIGGASLMAGGCRLYEKATGKRDNE